MLLGLADIDDILRFYPLLLIFQVSAVAINACLLIAFLPRFSLFSNFQTPDCWPSLYDHSTPIIAILSANKRTSHLFSLLIASLHRSPHANVSPKILSSIVRSPWLWLASSYSRLTTSCSRLAASCSRCIISCSRLRILCSRLMRNSC